MKRRRAYAEATVDQLRVAFPSCLLLAGILLMASPASSYRSLASPPPTAVHAPCVRSGYVFLECQRPDVTWDRVILNHAGRNESIDLLLQWCSQDPSCVAFSTDGLLVKAEPAHGKAGPFNGIDKCPASRNQGVSTWLRAGVDDCRGTYVFDGTVMQTNTQAGWPLTPTSVATAMNNGIANGAVITDAFANANANANSFGPQIAATYVASASRQTRREQGQPEVSYVRGRSFGGGKIGRALCVLC